MFHFRRVALAVVIVALVPSVVVACMWDYDTLKMERQRFPSTLELITGKFLRHSPEFYEWRVRDRLARLKTDPSNLALHDDLAVAYDKIGQHDKAIETMRAADKLQPNRYETQSNLATFLFHAGRLEESLERVEAALRINPDAHFGREKYQKYLTKYVIAQRVDGKIKLPLSSVKGNDTQSNFAAFLFFQPELDREHRHAADSAAIKGVLGMMRFANYDSPILLEALGSLLSSDVAIYQDAKRLAARAYLKASYEVKDEAAKQEYRKLATEVLRMQTRDPGTGATLPLEELEAEFQKELAEAKQWYAELHAKELGWIRDGKNVDEEFDKLYERDPEVTWANEGWHISVSTKQYLAVWAALVFVMSLVMFLVYRVFRDMRRKRAESSSSQ